MRIAIWYNLPSGGAKRALQMHVEGLTELGHTLEAWCPPTADRDFLPLARWAPEHVRPLCAPSRSSRILRRLRRFANFESVSPLERHCLQCLEEMATRKFEVLLSTSSLGAVVSPIGRLSQVPAALYLQEPNRYLYEARPLLPWVAAARHRPPGILGLLRELPRLQALRAQAYDEAMNIRGFDLVLANSYFSRENIVRAYGVGASVCYLGVDLRTFTDLKAAREDFILGIGTLGPLKNVELALETMSVLKKKHALHLPLVWVANSARREHLTSLKSRAKELDVDWIPKVRIADAELVALLNRGRLLLYTPRLEPFGLAPLEANACGMPVVGAAEGGVRETVIDGVNGVLAAPEPDRLADAMAHLLSDEPAARRLGSSASRHVRVHWRAEDAVKRLESELLRLSGAGR